MNLKWHQVLTAYVCDTAQTEVTGKGAQNYLRDHNIVDTDVERISLQFAKRQQRETKLRILLLEFHTKGMEKVLNEITNREAIPPFDTIYEQFKTRIEELL